ncbi:cell division protein FtsQ/DivIB [Rothia kristinae]|uniref:Cell division protein FtsQ/DivIB n=5 Tax=Rothia kristinae TaxID=37923 RepID=A0A7T3CFL0_9MICC|nr:cell division protein FtsQ/DivIB [Rothia kristinae]QPT53207.1 cell division protein FtsQ/DivIB [Rothia kristinae]SQC37182.1 cell division protein FtsQ [Rothia kristinae]
MSARRRPRLPRSAHEHAPEGAPAAAEREPEEPDEATQEPEGAPVEARQRLARRARENSRRSEESPAQAARRSLEAVRREPEAATGAIPVRASNPAAVSVEPAHAGSDAPGAPERDEDGRTGDEGAPDERDVVRPLRRPGSADRPAAAGPGEPGGSHPGEDGADGAAGNGASVIALTSRRRTEGSRGARRTSRLRRLVPRTRLGRIGAGLLTLVVVAAVFLGVVFASPLLAVRTITVEGTGAADRAEVARKLEPLEGTPLPRVTQQQVRDLIGQDVVIRDVSIEAHPPHELVVTLQERVPVAAVKDGDRYILVDRDGTAVGAADSVEQAKVPLIDGGRQAVTQDSFRDVVRVLQALPQSLLQQMTAAKAQSDTDIRLEMKDGSTVLWGTADDSEQKAQVLRALIQAVGGDGVSTYDVSSPDHPVTE